MKNNDFAVTAIAKVCHEANRAYCQSIGDFTIPPWDTAPHWQQAGSIHGVEYRMNNPYATPEDIHRMWMDEKLATGWKHGPEKCPVTKRHPSLVPWEKLPEKERRKDVLFSNIVAALYG